MRALLVLAALAAAWGTAARAGDPIPAKASPAIPAPPALMLTGDLQPRATVKVFARASGVVEKVYVRESAMVRENDVLAEIDPREYAIEVAQARAALEFATAKAQMMNAGGRPEERARALAEVASAEAVVRDAAGHHERMEALHGRGGVSRQSVDSGRRELSVARARVVSAKKSAALVNEGPREEERRMARAELDRMRESLRMAELKLSYCKVRAPFAGCLGQRLVDEGAYVMAASSPQAPPLFVLSDSRVMKGMLDVPESQLMLVRVGARARVTVQSLPDRTLEGTVANVYPYVDPKTRTGKVELAVPNHRAELLSGMFIKAEVDSAPARAASLAEVLGVKVPTGSVE